MNETGLPNDLECFMALAKETSFFEEQGVALTATSAFFVDRDGSLVAEPASELHTESTHALSGSHVLSLEWAQVREGIVEGRYTPDDLTRIESISRRLLIGIGMIKSMLAQIGRDGVEEDPSLAGRTAELLAAQKKANRAKLH